MTHRSVLHVLLNESYFFMFIWPAVISPPPFSLSPSPSPSLSPSLSPSPLPPQPILSEAVLDQYRENKSSVPPGMTPDKYLKVMVSYLFTTTGAFWVPLISLIYYRKLGLFSYSMLCTKIKTHEHY